MASFFVSSSQDDDELINLSVMPNTLNVLILIASC